MPLTHDQYQEIFEDISEGKSLRSALRSVNSGFSQFYKGLKDNPKLEEQYAHARSCQAESSFEAILTAVNDVKNGVLDPNAGRVVIDTYKWISARLKPTVYADKPLLGGGDNSPTELIVRWGKPKEDIKTLKDAETIDIPQID